MDTNGINENILSQELREHTEAPPELKEEIWEGIEQELFYQKRQGEYKKMKKRNRFMKFAVAAAAVALLIVGIQTETGHAFIDQIREMFAPEKEVAQDIEGIEEESNLHLNEGIEASYVIYVDEERYRMVNEENRDLIVPKEPLGSAYPEVSMEIKQVVDRAPEDLLGSVEADLKEEFAEVSPLEEVTSPVKGWKIFGIEGSQWDSPFYKVYVISNGHEGSFIITQKYFLEAEEGHGARFDEMLKEFHLVEE